MECEAGFWEAPGRCLSWAIKDEKDSRDTKDGRDRKEETTSWWLNIFAREMGTMATPGTPDFKLLHYFAGNFPNLALKILLPCIRVVHGNLFL
ncbi:MAG: hypothetical protein AMXMBFR48_25610 [Ignavibacteriales bacterium]